MIWKSTVLLSFALCVLSDGHHATSKQRSKINYKDYPKEHHGQYGEPSHVDSKELEHHKVWSYPSYEFSYKVHDPHTHYMKSQHETRDGGELKGEYWLIQPDGLKRTVTYHADKHSGFHATVHISDNHNHLHHENKKQEEKNNEEESNYKKKEDSYQIKEEENEDKEKEHVAEENKKYDDKRQEEGHGNEEHVGKWIHDRHWGHNIKGKYDVYQHSKDHKHDHHHMTKENEWYKRDDKHKDIKTITIFSDKAYYGQQVNNEHGEGHGLKNKHNDEKDETEDYGIRPRFEFDDGYTHPSYKTGSDVIESYYHPHFIGTVKAKNLGSNMNKMNSKNRD